jgi:lysophospholipase L1-like esterase
MHSTPWAAIRPTLLCLVSAALLSGNTFAAPAPATPPPNTDTKPILKAIELKDGDTLVFLGDSITHQCLYTQYLEDYFYTRYPKLKLHFHNSGVGGDRAADALRRFDEDVAAFKPKFVTVLLGMNDGSYRDFDKATFDTYQADMAKLLDRIAGLGAQAVVMTPTMHDARAARMSKRGPQEPRDTYYNGVLALYGAWLREQAHIRGLGFVDMYSPLNNLTLQERKAKPEFTLIKDAVHPDAPGQVVMATAILSDMIPRSSVSGLNGGLNPRGVYTVAGANGKVTDVKQTGDTVSFTFAANALPWVLPADAAEGFKLTKAGHRYSNEKLTMRNLKPGKYDVRIDGELIGTYTDALLARGVELQENAKTPQYQQALAVATLNKERNDKAMRPLRDLWRDLKLKQRTVATAPNDADKKKALEDFLATFGAKTAELKAKVAEYDERIYAINQPKPRRYEIAPAK